MKTGESLVKLFNRSPVNHWCREFLQFPTLLHTKQKAQWKSDLGADGSLCRGIVQSHHARRPHVSYGCGHKNRGGAHRVRPCTVGYVVDPRPILELNQSMVLARVPVVGTGPAILSAVLPLDYPPIASNLVGEICQFLNGSIDGEYFKVSKIILTRH